MVLLHTRIPFARGVARMWSTLLAFLLVSCARLSQPFAFAPAGAGAGARRGRGHRGAADPCPTAYACHRPWAKPES